MDAGAAGLAGGHFLALADQRGIPGCGHGERDGVDRAEAVDDVVAEEKRDVVRALCDGDLLKLVDADGVGGEEKAADGTFAGKPVGVGG